MMDREELELRDSIERMTQNLMQYAVGPLLAAGLSPEQVVTKCHKVAMAYTLGLVQRYETPLDTIPRVSDIVK